MDLSPGRAADLAAGLTDREREVLTLVARGKTDWEIARILGVAENTARFHVDNARRKLSAVNRAHAVARFLLASFAAGGAAGWGAAGRAGEHSEARALA